MNTQHVTLLAKAHNGKVTVSAEIPISGDIESYVVSIDVTPQVPLPSQTLDQLYEALADSPIPGAIVDPLPEQRDKI